MGGHGTGADEAGRWIGPYRIVATLGEGGMGAVHLGRDARGRPAAVKVLRGELARDESMVRRFRREAEAASMVRGPGVAPVLAYDLDGPVPWIAAAYLAGPTLQEAVAEYGVFPEAGARALVAELARAVAVIHEAGLVHRDLKPANIVLTREGARIIDFGIARPEYGLTLTQPGVAPATPGYAPPEQITGRRAGPAADVFALGAVLVFACTGQGPFGTGHPAAVGFRVVHEEPDLEGVPEALVPVARACLQKDPARRPTPEVVAGWVEGAEFGPAGSGGAASGEGTVRWLPADGDGG
ncbi:serine/threonine-protein kinase, partial [Streptomyces fulvoviolaceus]|uniref:serine/threonine-protein kinase n=1 Tax=Streptomyces fulvoviolaceus TaxID=285535 RepID=UPI0021BE24E8